MVQTDDELEHPPPHPHMNDTKQKVGTEEYFTPPQKSFFWSNVISEKIVKKICEDTQKKKIWI